jgi:hypothetical protein
MSVWRLDGSFHDESDPSDVADAIWDRDLICLLDIVHNDDVVTYAIEDILEEVNARRAVAGRPAVQPIGDATTWLLSSRPVVDSRVILNDSLPTSVEVLWARVLTGAATPAAKGQPWRAGEFVDVYCGSRDEGLIEATRATDRPAFALGDLVRAPEKLTPFDAANQWLSDVYDLGAIAVPQHPGLTTTHAVILPATDEWPTFGVLVDPTAATTTHDDGDGDPISADPELSATVELVRTDQPGHWNPQKHHILTYAITRLEDLASGGCCADWNTDGIGFPGHEVKVFGDDETPDGDIVDPGWRVSIELATGAIIATASVWDWDAGSNDHYDVVPGSDRDPFFRIDHASGVVQRVDAGGTVQESFGSFETSPDGMGIATTGSTAEAGSAFHLLTVTEVN